MTSPATGGRGRRLLAATSVALLTAGLTASVGQSAAAKTSDTGAAKPSAAKPAGPAHTDGRYIVVMKDLPVAAYAGTIRGYAATKPAKGAKFAPNSAAAVRYRQLLAARQEGLRRSAGVSARYAYTDSLNGFSATLKGSQAAKLASNSQVVAVVKDTLRHVDAAPASTLSYLGLNGANGVWSKVGGPTGASGAGNGLAIGVVDSGIWPESPSFAPTSPNRIPRGWTGTCQTGERFNKADCNGKIIGARYYVDGFGAANVAPEDYLSPRDGSGHGSHTASTAAGDYNVKVQESGRDLGTISGMAPMARIAAYKVCWTGDPAQGVPDGCFTSDSVAAIDQAVKDGVDAINYSIGAGSESYFLDPVEIAFLYASDAGVFVAASAGNSGPGASTLDHPSPWLATVAASTYTVNEGTVVLGNGARYIGASLTTSLPTFTPTILSSSAAAPGAPAADAQLCAPNSLTPTKAAGKVVVCDRGVVARIDKSYEVQRAGGVGMILVNTTPADVVADFHPIPTVHLDAAAGAKVKAYVATAAHPVSKILAGVNTGSKTTFPNVIEFSSRGPMLQASGDLLKPDIAAPGVDILAAVAPPSNHGHRFNFYSGTSMAAPHIAGLSLLIKDKYRTWSPAMVRSAMMTTASDTKKTRDVFAQGAGLVEPRRFLDPGLVYNAGSADYRAYLKGQGVAIDGVRPIDASNLNQPSIAIGDLAGIQTVRRTVTNVGSTTATYTAKVTGLRGVTARVSPSTITLKPGLSATFTIKFTRTTAPFGAFTQGHLLWQDGKHSVRSPIAVRPIPLAAPEELHGVGASGSATVRVVPGFTGTLGTRVDGLVAGATPISGSAPVTPFDPAAPTGTSYTVTVPANAALARFELDAVDNAGDLDLYVYNAAGELVGASATGSADERVTLKSPAAGTYKVYVNVYAVSAGGTAAWRLTNFVVPSGPAGNATVTPASVAVTTGQPVDVTVTWTGLDTSKRWLGLLRYLNGTETVGSTVVSVG